MINRIEHLLVMVPTNGIFQTWDTPIDPAKAVVLLYGAAYAEQLTGVGTYNLAYAWELFPIWYSLGSQSIFIDWSETPHAQAYVSAAIIEYI